MVHPPKAKPPLRPPCPLHRVAARRRCPWVGLPGAGVRVASTRTRSTLLIGPACAPSLPPFARAARALHPQRSPHLRHSCGDAHASALPSVDGCVCPCQYTTTSDLTAIMTMSPSTPSIRISGSSLHQHHYPLPHHRRPSYSPPSGAMAIPRARQEVPPPLPPPRYIGDELRESGVDPGWTWGNTTNCSTDTGFKGNRHAAIKPGSSLLSGAARAQPSYEHPPDHSLPSARDSPSDRSFDDADSLEQSDEDFGGKPRQRPSNHRYVFRTCLAASAAPFARGEPPTSAPCHNDPGQDTQRALCPATRCNRCSQSVCTARA